MMNKSKLKPQKVYMDSDGMECCAPGVFKGLANKFSPQPDNSEERYDNKFRIAPYSLTSLLKRFPTIWLKEGYKLVGYQYVSSGGSNGFPFVIPEEKNLPDPSDLDLDFFQLLDRNSPSLPDWVDPYIEQYIQGDGSPASYFEASICLRALNEMGAFWHGSHWSSHQLITSKAEAKEIVSRMVAFQWTAEGRKLSKHGPTEWRPCVEIQTEGSITVKFYTYTEVGRQTIYLFQDAYTTGYLFETTNMPIGVGEGGIIY